jgi:uncharacterized membrane protein
MLRTLRERVLQTVSFEVSELVITVPMFAYFAETSGSDSLLVLVAIGIAATCWTAIHNVIFDWVEFKSSERVASDRPDGIRVVHAISLAVSCAIVSIPILVLLGGLSWQEAIIADMGLTVLDAIYAFIFFRLYDFIRPITSPDQSTNLQGV